MSEEQAKYGISHVDAAGRASMVDVAAKPKTHRVARAASRIRMQPATADAIRGDRVAKGAVLATARVAGILAAKKTADLIPLCHPLEITRIAVDFEYEGDDRLVITATVEAVDRTGVEMEALTACSVAALTVYDMCKALDRGMTIEATQLVMKSGGKSGEYRR